MSVKYFGLNDYNLVSFKIVAVKDMKLDVKESVPQVDLQIEDCELVVRYLCPRYTSSARKELAKKIHKTITDESKNNTDIINFSHLTRRDYNNLRFDIDSSSINRECFKKWIQYVFYILKIKSSQSNPDTVIEERFKQLQNKLGYNAIFETISNPESCIDNLKSRFNSISKQQEPNSAMQSEKNAMETKYTNLKSEFHTAVFATYGALIHSTPKPELYHNPVLVKQICELFELLRNPESSETELVENIKPLILSLSLNDGDIEDLSKMSLVSNGVTNISLDEYYERFKTESLDPLTNVLDELSVNDLIYQLKELLTLINENDDIRRCFLMTSSEVDTAKKDVANFESFNKLKMEMTDRATTITRLEASLVELNSQIEEYKSSTTNLESHLNKANSQNKVLQDQVKTLKQNVSELSSQQGTGGVQDGSEAQGGSAELYPNGSEDQDRSAELHPKVSEDQGRSAELHPNGSEAQGGSAELHSNGSEDQDRSAVLHPEDSEASTNSPVNKNKNKNKKEKEKKKKKKKKNEQVGL